MHVYHFSEIKNNLTEAKPQVLFALKTCFTHFRRHALYSVDDEPSDVLELGPTRKKICISILFFPYIC